jgi:hypothetical protein
MSTSTPNNRVSLIRRIGFAVIAAAAVVVTVLGAPASPEPISTETFERQITVALEDYESNEASTSGAPQQQVVNGWVARDLLTILAQQTNAVLAASQTSATDPRVPILLMLLVLALTLYAVTLPTPLRQAADMRHDRSADSSPSHHGQTATRSSTTEYDPRTLE